jgi:hypothetical protein
MFFATDCRQLLSRRGIARVEWLVAGAVIGILAALFLPDQNTRVLWDIERRIQDWESASHTLSQPDLSLVAPDVALAGNWSVSRHRQGSRLELSPDAAGNWRARFETGGCLGRCALDRTAQFTNGVLLLDRPVSEYLPVTYDRLYAIRFDGQDFLLPEAMVEEFEEAIAADPKANADSLAVRFCLFRREP